MLWEKRKGGRGKVLSWLLEFVCWFFVGWVVTEKGGAEKELQRERGKEYVWWLVVCS